MGTPAGSPASGGTATGTATAGQPPLRTVAELLDGREPPGALVRAAGRCRGYGRAPAAGPPPVTRSDWLLEDAGRAIYVVGARPAGCAATGTPQGAPTAASDPDAPVTLVARVAVDTLAAIGAGPGVPRRYLVVPR